MAFCAFPPSAVGQDSSILELATASEDLTDLVFALNATGLTDALDAEGPFTVFAPLNGAFADSEIFFYLEPAWILHLASTLFYHVVDGASPLDSLEVGDELPTLFGSSLTVASLQPYIIEDVEVEDTVEATNGIVNLIEEVLLPPFSQTNIPTIAALSNDFSILVSLLERADLVDVLAEGAYTVFAPTNAAFEKIPPENVEYLISEEGLEDLTDILLTHVVEGIAYGEFVMAGDMVTAVNGVNLTVTSVDPLTITAAGDSLIVAPDVLASNGVIHVIDTVLLPPAPETLAPTSVSSSEATPVDTVIDTTMGPTPAVTVDETTMGPTAGPLGGENTIVDIAVATPAFETLVALVTVADLVGALSGEGPFTLFAPINNGKDDVGILFFDLHAVFLNFLNHIMFCPLC